jgi:hypothetical protein
MYQFLLVHRFCMCPQKLKYRRLRLEIWEVNVVDCHD